MKHDSWINHNLDVVNLAEERSGLKIDKLFEKLNSIKNNIEPQNNIEGKESELTPSEKLYLCLMLCQYPSRELASIYKEYKNNKNLVPSKEEIYKNRESLDQQIKNLRSQASKGLNRYLKELLKDESKDESSNLPQSKNGKLAEALLKKDEDLKICKIIKELKNNGYSQTNSNNSHPETKASMTITSDQIIPNNKLNEILNSLKQIAPSFELVVVYKNLTDN